MYRLCLFWVALSFFLTVPARADLTADLAKFNELCQKTPAGQRWADPAIVAVAQRIAADYDLADHSDKLRDFTRVYLVLVTAATRQRQHQRCAEFGGRLVAQDVPYTPDLELVAAHTLRAAQKLGDPARRVELADRCRALLGPNLGMNPTANVYQPMADIYLAVGRVQDALALVTELIGHSPWLYGDVTLWESAESVFRRAGKTAEAKQAARLGFMLSDYEENSIRRAMRLVTGVFTTEMDLVAANAFLEYQKDGTGTNPLAAIPLPTLKEEEKATLLDVAQRAGRYKTEALISAHLMLGDFDEAVALAKSTLTGAANNLNLDEALLQIARCFKAKDMNLIRANQFLQHVKTGAGESPLEDF